MCYRTKIYMSFDYFFETVNSSKYIYKNPKLDKLTNKEITITKGSHTDITYDLSKELDVISSIKLNCSAQIKIMGAENNHTYLSVWINKDTGLDFPSILSSDKLQLSLLHISCPDDIIKITLSGISFSNDIKCKLANTCVFTSTDFTGSKNPLQYVITKHVYEKHVHIGYYD